MSRITEILDESLDAHRRLRDDGAPAIAAVADAFIQALGSGRKVLICGNGGSAADALHVAGEFVGRFAYDRPALPVIALTADSATLTAVANDLGYEQVFSRQVEALAQSGDVVVGISTSGASLNVVRALEAARRKRCVTIAFTGEEGGQVSAVSDVNFHAPSRTTARVQELHLLAWHAICQLVEAELCPRPP